MNSLDDLRRELHAARERIAALNAAILRTSASLDLATVLQEAVDTARALTAARYGIITTVDEAGAVRDFVSSGFTETEHRQFIEWPDGPKLFAHLRDLLGPVRLTDLPALVRSLGFSPDLMRCRGRRPARASPRARRAHPGGLRGAGHRRAGRDPRPHPRRAAQARGARPHAARDRRH